MSAREVGVVLLLVAALAVGLFGLIEFMPFAPPARLG